MRAQGRLVTPEEFGDVIVRANPDGSLVRVRDVATIEMGSLNYNQAGSFNGKPAGVIAAFQLPGSNALDVAAAVRAAMVDLKKRFPPGMDYEVSLDTTAPVKAGIEEILITLLEAIGLVVLVVFIFLQSWRATLIPLLTVPVSLVGVFAVFPLLGFSINTLSLFALVLAIGLVVDDAIVVVEAVEHHIEEGMSPRDATFKAMSEVQAPVIGIALILAAVFIPVAFMAGITGRLYQQFALTIAVSVLISAFNALTLSPALAAMLLRPRRPRARPLARLGQRVQPRVRARDQRLRPHQRAPGAQAGDPAVAAGRASARCRRRSAASCRRASCPRRTTATPSSACSSPTRRRCSARRRCSSKVEEILGPHRGHPHLQHGRRLQLLHRFGGQLRRHRLHGLSAVEAARSARPDAPRRS